MPRYERTLELRAPIEQVFAYLCEPTNMIRVSLPETQMRLLAAPESLAIGDRLRFQVQAYGHTQVVEHEILTLQAPVKLVERQIEGPLKLWRHTHSLSGDQSTLLVDEIEFEPPGGLVGLLVNERFLRKMLDRSMEHRDAIMRADLEVEAA